MIAMRRAFTLAELVFVALIIAGLMVVMFRVYRVQADYETARQVNEFVKAVDKGLYMVGIVLQSSSFRKSGVSGIEGDNGGLYLIVSDTSYDSVYRALMNGDCMVRCFDSSDGNNLECGGSVVDFSGMCRDDMLCLEGVLEKKYLNTYVVPKVLQGRVQFEAVVLKDPYEVVVSSRGGRTILAGQLVKLTAMRMDLSEVPDVARILQNIDRKYANRGGGVLDYPLNNYAGHLVIVRSGYVCQ
jgi:hypothetical protein